MADETRLHDAILTGDAKGAREATAEALAGGRDPERVLEGQMIPAMREAGRRFEQGEYFIPELLIAARAMKAALELLRPLLSEKGAAPKGVVAIGTVRGDVHDIGKNLVAAMLTGAGFQVLDLGVDVPPAKFVAAVRDGGATVVAMSSLLTTTMLAMRDTVAALAEAGLRDRVKVIVGGAPVTPDFAQNIGADGFGDNANAAVALAISLSGS
jgi:corrinoid protein of di/trimethylamine methyltransferase